jgi:hypothetical protein
MEHTKHHMFLVSFPTLFNIPASYCFNQAKSCFGWMVAIFPGFLFLKYYKDWRWLHVFLLQMMLILEYVHVYYGTTLVGL